MKVHLAIRGYGAGVQQFEDLVEVEEESLDALLPDLAEKHAEVLVPFGQFMIEVEFLDEPDPLQRFFRMGSDPRMMVQPVHVDLDQPN